MVGRLISLYPLVICEGWRSRLAPPLGLDDAMMAMIWFLLLINPSKGSNSVNNFTDGSVLVGATAPTILIFYGQHNLTHYAVVFAITKFPIEEFYVHFRPYRQLTTTCFSFFEC